MSPPENLAEIAFSEGRLTDALGLLTHASWGNPRKAHLLHLLSETCLRLGAEECALSYATAALSVDPNYRAPLAVQIEVAIRRRELKRATALLEKYPSEGATQQMHALLRLRLQAAEEKYELALAELSELIDGRNDLVLARQLFASIFYEFSNDNDHGRFTDFLDAVGLDLDRSRDRVPDGQTDQACVDLIIPVHNSLHHLQGCIQSIQSYPDPALRRIILVNDASEPETALWIERFVAESSNAILVQNNQNLGFTRSVVAGINASDAPFFILLNSDTLVSHGWITGLLRGLCSDKNHAMAGPLSNLAYFQSIAPDSPTGSSLDPISVERRSAFIRANGTRDYRAFPFLSGFCLMLRRAHYNAAGGLDAERFPRGYWEVQDLALRMIDLGLIPCLVDDVYVHHLQSGSTEATQRVALLTDGFRKICDSHGTIRVLAAEELSRASEPVHRQRNAMNAFFTAEQSAVGVRFDAQSLVDAPAEYSWRIPPSAELNIHNQEVCLFVAHTPFGQLHEWTARYLRELKSTGLNIVVCLVVADVSAPIQPQWDKYADAVLLRSNSGFDFGAWADVLRLLPELWTASRLIFANDSVVGPFKSLEPIFEKIRTEDSGFFALTDSTTPKYHAQSYFFGWSGRNLSDNCLRSFWAQIENFTDKQSVIDQYELSLWDLSATLADPNRQIIFGMRSLFGERIDLVAPFSPAHWGWKALIEIGSPFVKTAVLQAEPGSIDKVVEMTGTDKDMLVRHIEQVRLAVLHSSMDKLTR